MRHHPFLVPLILAALAVAVPPVAGQASSGRVLKDPATGEPIIGYVLSAPSGTPRGKRLGLMVGMHGAGGNEVQGTRPIQEGLRDLDLQGEYVVLGLKSKGGGWRSVDDEPVHKALAWVMKKYPIDPRRVYGWGFSSGAGFLGRFAPRNPGLFAGVVLSAGGVGSPARDERAAEHGLQYYIMIGELDKGSPPSRSRAGRARLEQSGHRFVYRELTGIGHTNFGSRPSGYRARGDAMGWCHAIRSGQAARTEQQDALLDKIEQKLAADKSVSPRELDGVADIGGPRAAGLIAAACRSQKSGVRAAAARSCAKVLLGPTAITALATLVDDENKNARSAAFEALGRAANWNSPVAQMALCDLAADAGRKPGERADAIEALAVAVPLELESSYRHPLLMGTLIDLLMDPAASIRGHAFRALMGKGSRPAFGLSAAEPPTPTGFGYSPRAAASSRAKAQQRWRQWREG